MDNQLKPFVKKASTISTVASTTPLASTQTSLPLNLNKSEPLDVKKLCQMASGNMIDLPTTRIGSKPSEDDEQNDLISVEDEIYNLAFRPAKPS